MPTPQPRSRLVSDPCSSLKPSSRLSRRRGATSSARFFTLLGIIVSVAFLVAVVAVIQGMNAYVKDSIAGAIIGVNAFQVRRTPIAIGLIDDEEWRAIAAAADHRPRGRARRARALPDARAISHPVGLADAAGRRGWRDRTVGDAFVFGVTAPLPDRAGLPVRGRATR